MTTAPQATGVVALAERIELWPIDRLRPYERNPRTHSDAQVDQIAASMVEFGWTNPILIDENAGILAGHGRLLAARQLGLAEVPEPPEDPVSKPGDLWVLGNHRLLCGDATVLADVERVLGGQLADMTFCDPPYNVDYANAPKDKLRGKHRPILNDSLGSGFEAFLYDACVNILSATKGACYICMSSSELD